MSRKYLKGGLFNRGKARVLEPRKNVWQNLKPEERIQVDFFNWIKLYEKQYPVLQLLFAVPNGGFRFETTAKIMKAQGVRAGVWDLIALAPSANGEFNALVIELKTDTGDLSPSQKTFEKLLQQFNPRTSRHVSRAWFTTANIVIDYFGLPLEKLSEKSQTVNYFKTL